MRPESDERPQQGGGKKHTSHAGHGTWPRPEQIKAPPVSRTGKSMHHPAFRIGEIKHGK
jgi:hypothetical protein